MFRTFIAFLIFIFYRLLQLTWRVQIHETPEVKKLMAENKGFISAHWHGDEIGLFHLLKRYQVACMVSTSRDGDLVNRLVPLFGGRTVRGSSTRGGVRALKAMVALVEKQARRPSVAVDGPKGPIYKVKSGIFQISRLTELPIIPLSFHASKSHLFKNSWNQAQLPLPFAKITIQWGDLLPALNPENDPKDPQFQQILEERLHATKKLAIKKNQENKAFL